MLDDYKRMVVAPMIQRHRSEIANLRAEIDRLSAQGLDAATIERCADEIGRRVAERNGGLGVNGSVYAAATVGAREALALNTASTTTRGEDARLREALIRAMICLSGFAGEGLFMPGYEDPADAWTFGAKVLDMMDADEDDLRAALQGDAAHTSQEKGNG